MEFWKDLFSVIQAALTSAAIVIGGFWTYLLFIRQRLGFPKLKIDFSLDEKILPEGVRFIHAVIKINNVGSVVLRSDYAELRIRQVVPIPEKLKIDINEDYDPIPKGKTEYEWPMIAGREWKWDKGEFEIEPGESDSLHADYLIPNKIEVVEFYCYIANAKKKRQGIGWTLTKIYKFSL